MKPASTKDIIKDFVVIISSAASIIIGGFSLVAIASYIRMISITYESIGGYGGFSETMGRMLGGYWSCLIFCIIFTIIGVFNIIYIRRWLRDLLPKNYVGYTANIGAVLVSGLLLAGLIISSNIYNFNAVYIPVFVSTTSGLFVFHFILLSIGIVAQIASTILMFKWEDTASCKVIDITQTTPGAIMLSGAALKAERETPPVLNADPNAPMQPAGHTIWDPSLVTPIQSDAPAPVQPEPAVPVQPVSYDQQAMMSATAQQTVASMQPGYDVAGATFAQPGLEPTMNPYVQSGTYIQPDDGFMQTPPSVQQ